MNPGEVLNKVLHVEAQLRCPTPYLFINLFDGKGTLLALVLSF